jgi:hypothetical protein
MEVLEETEGKYCYACSAFSNFYISASLITLYKISWASVN